MAKGWKFGYALCILLLSSFPLLGQVQSASQVEPVPIPGGDILPPLFNQFFPGIGAGFDGLNADPHGITNFRGFVAMGYTNGQAVDNAGKSYGIITDIRVYQGEYVGGEIAAANTGGATKSAKAHGTFVEIWIDFYTPSLGGTQVHDLNPGITPNGVFWIVQVPDDAVEISGDSLTIHLKNVSLMDQFFFPGGPGKVPATVSFDITYTKSGRPRRVRPTSSDPLSPFNWAGTMWSATNSGTFSMAYNDGSFSAQGSFSSSGNFGEMGTERNGSFVEREDESDRDTDADSQGPASDQIQESQSGAAVPGNQTSENLATALKSSRARALRDWKSKP